MTVQKSAIGERSEPPRVALGAGRVGQLAEGALKLWDLGGKLLRTDKLDRAISVAAAGADMLTLARPSSGPAVCRHAATGAPSCQPVDNALVSERTQLVVGSDGTAWLAADKKLREVGSGTRELARPPGATWLVDGTLVEESTARVAWTPLGGTRHEVSAEACERRMVAGATDLVLLNGWRNSPGTEGRETWRAVRVDSAGKVTRIGDLQGHPYDVAAWKQGVAVLRANRDDYGQDVVWEVVLLEPGAAPRVERLPLQPRYNLMWDSGFAVAASDGHVAVGNGDRLALFDLAQGKWSITDGPVD